jgi:hypothetical protein
VPDSGILPGTKLGGFGLRRAADFNRTCARSNPGPSLSCVLARSYYNYTAYPRGTLKPVVQFFLQGSADFPGGNLRCYGRSMSGTITSGLKIAR